MNVDEAEEILNQLTDFYGRKPMTKTALKYWCKGILRFSRLAAQRGLAEVWDNNSTMPARNVFVAAVRAQHDAMNPPADSQSERVEPWEERLGAAAISFFVRYLDGSDSLNDWANNFRSVARAQGVEGRINWEAWEGIGVTFYV